MKPLSELLEGVTDIEEQKQLLATGIQQSGVTAGLPTWIAMMEIAMDSMASHLIRIIYADAPADQQDESAKAFVDVMQMERMSILYELLSKVANNPVSKLVVPK